jgi:hypothetical protein
MKNFRKIELSLLLTYFIFTILTVSGYNIPPVILFIALMALVSFWLYALFRPGGERIEGFKTGNLLEKLLVSVLLLGISMNITGVAFSALILKLGLTITGIYYVINGIIKLFKKDQRLSGLERFLGGLALAALLGRFMHWPGSNFLWILSLGILGIAFFIYGLVLIFKMNKQWTGLLLCGIYSSLELGLFFIIFDTMFWSGSAPIFSLSLLITAACSALLFVRQASVKHPLEEETRITLINPTWRRIIIITGICMFFNTLTVKQFIRMKFGNRLSLIEANYNCHFKSPGQPDSDYCKTYHELHDQYKHGLLPEEHESGQIREAVTFYK